MNFLFAISVRSSNGVSQKEATLQHPKMIRYHFKGATSHRWLGPLLFPITLLVFVVLLFLVLGIGKAGFPLKEPLSLLQAFCRLPQSASITGGIGICSTTSLFGERWQPFSGLVYLKYFLGSY